MLKKLFSFFIPVNIYKKSSSLSKSLEVTWANGELVLDSQNTNYSYGSLQRILRMALKSVGFNKVKEMQHILVLGVAGGSVIKTLRDEIRTKAWITGVEIDAEIVKLANTYFKLDKIPNTAIIIDDAFDFVIKTEDTYDLIVIDIFQDTSMPAFLFDSLFADRICELLSAKGIAIFNTMVLKNTDELRNREYILHFDVCRFKVSAMSRLETHNEVIIIEKLN